MRKNIRKKTSVIVITSICFGVLMPFPVQATVKNGWEIVGGNAYWYENGVKQGTEGRGKEIYDPKSKAWYWLDSVNGGKKATNKDLYQESEAGQWAEKEDGTGKWVRYDENGHMIKGWDNNEKGTYYFDLTYGTMAKGKAEIDGLTYYFNEKTGILEYSTGNVAGDKNGWQVIDGAEYWYENGVRQGMEGRGKEIYDPKSDAWYWLDSVNDGKKATSKDVYQESKADEAGNIGKWVRYDENGHMVKGWSADRKYYFDETYGTMAKGEVVINGANYYFDTVTGELIRTDYDDSDYGPNNDGVTDYDDTDYGPNNDGVTDYDDTDYGPNNDGVTDYDDTDYGPSNDGVTDYDDTDYGPNNDGVTDYDDTDYGPNNDGVTDYDDGNSNYDDSSDYGSSDYGSSDYGSSDYDD